MSGFELKADMCSAQADVRYVPIADMVTLFWSQLLRSIYRQNSDQSDDQVESDWLADQLGGEQSCRDWVHGHRIGHSRWRRSLESHYPENERECTAANSKINTGKPLWRNKSAQDGHTARQQSDHHKRDRSSTHSNREEPEST